MKDQANQVLNRSIDSWREAFLSPFRHTIAQSISYHGIGVHGGEPSTVSMSPNHQPRSDSLGVYLNGYPLREWEVYDTVWSTKISHPHGGELRMVEHLFAALYASGIDDVHIWVEGNELPILDGSALEYITPIKPTLTWGSQSGEAGPFKRSDLYLSERLDLNWRDSALHYDPSIEALSAPLPLSAKLKLNIEPLMTQHAELRTLDDLYFKVIPAKTFGFLSDESSLRALGLIQGVTLQNTRVYDESGQALTPLPYDSESAYHKLLDLLGDLYLLGQPLRGHIDLLRGGHHLHHLLVDTIRAKVFLGEASLNSRILSHFE